MLKMQGGYLPKIAGCPEETLEEIAVPEIVSIDLSEHSIDYYHVVASGDEVSIGQPIAKADTAAGTVYLPSPVSGTVTLDMDEDDEDPVSVTISIKRSGDQSNGSKSLDASKATPEEMQKALLDAGVWQSIWSSATQGIPSVDSINKLDAVVVTLALTEPFRASSDVVWKQWQDRIGKGIEFLSALLADEGKLEFAFTSEGSEAVEGLKKLTDGKNNARFHQVPCRYPVENPRTATKLLRTEGLQKDAKVWVMDLQTVAGVGACLGEGTVPTHCIVALGGPSAPAPKHFLVEVGTPINKIVAETDKLLVLRGGLFNGRPVDVTSGTLGYGDDALFCMPTEGKSEMVSFINPGFNRRSIYPSFISLLTGAPDSHLSGTIRGEHRPCIACSSCEKVCPAGLMPQAIHRLLYSDEYDDAEALGLELCVECGACAYVCPSKLDLNTEFAEAKRVIKVEKEAALAVSSDTKQADETAE